ncbi:hypothetical protein [Spirillospora albida]|uniref:hypothetical protein n=1 Tax=Spirillospora albida TaxID=58123 RepID=UPI0004BF5FCA|nr:hypothetical protein [Spirillospora albida]
MQLDVLDGGPGDRLRGRGVAEGLVDPVRDVADEGLRALVRVAPGGVPGVAEHGHRGLVPGADQQDHRPTAEDVSMWCAVARVP